MKSRFFWMIAVATVLILFVAVGQICLEQVSDALSSQADDVCDLLSQKGREQEGMELLDAFVSEFEHRRPFLGIFVNDARIHEIQRALSRAKRLGEMGDISPAMEALTDISRSMKELSETHRPTWGNIL